MIVIAPVCFECVNYIGRLAGEDGEYVCEAFPNGIPEDLMLTSDHKEPWEGDNGIQFEAFESVDSK